MTLRAMPGAPRKTRPQGPGQSSIGEAAEFSTAWRTFTLISACQVPLPNIGHEHQSRNSRRFWFAGLTVIQSCRPVSRLYKALQILQPPSQFLGIGPTVDIPTILLKVGFDGFGVLHVH